MRVATSELRLTLICSNFARRFLLMAAVFPALINVPQTALGQSRLPGEKALIFHGLTYPTSTPAFLQENQRHLRTIPFDGLTVYLRGEGENLTRSLMTGQRAISYATFRSVLEPYEKADLGNLRDNFAIVLNDRPGDPFDYNAWTNVVQSFANLARAARDVGLKGIFYDNEEYFGRWHNYATPAEVQESQNDRYPLYPPLFPFSDYEGQTRRLGRRIMAAMVREYPEIQLIVMHGPYHSVPNPPTRVSGTSEELFRTDLLDHNELKGPFFVGLVEGAVAPENVIDGGLLYWLRSRRAFEESYEWRKYTISSPLLNIPFIPVELRGAWANRVGISFGVYDQSYRGADMNHQIARMTMANALNVSDRYVWFYPETITFLMPKPAPCVRILATREVCPAPQAWWDAVRIARANVTP